ncbi:type II toxin-antitoxin system CcdA family antitoxin [Luteimonas saliphila]|uniref:type II toxin-antitoxin system CcdA family antitoxin n=1 Tax=Luteimonas saliphila TaxID=2804919 RepID=UPI00192DF692|nr:type II toxin-antitoxin system CcdA family antitoxin [Luteimonas saliphila]
MRIREDYAGYGKRAANVSINQGLLEEAKALDINLSATLEKALAAEVRARKRSRWLEDNREAIAAYNRRIERDGMLSDHVRAFVAGSGE